MNKKIIFGIAGILLLLVFIILISLGNDGTQNIEEQSSNNLPPQNLQAQENKKEYNEETKEVKIKDKDTNENVANLKLNTPLNVKTGIGYQKVAEFELRANKGYQNAFEKVEFYDLKNGNRSIERNFDYKYKTIKTVDLENVSCDEFTGECEVLNTYKHNVVDWIELEDYDFNAGEVLTIGLFTNVQEGDYVEWIPTYFGVRIPEWASWNGTLGDGLVSYYGMNETSGNIIDAVGSNDGTANGNPTYENEGIQNGSIGFDGTGDYFNLGNDASLQITGDLTIAGWVKDVEPDGFIYAKDDGSNRDYRGIINGGGVGTLGCGVFISNSFKNANSVANVSAISENQWTFFTCRYNGSFISTWINGTEEARTSATGSIDNDAVSLFFGRRSDGSNELVGEEDEIGIWNRSLTDGEIKTLYCSGDGIAYTETCGSTSSNITLNSPPDNYNSTNATIDFNVTVTDDTGVGNVTLFINNTKIETNTSGVNGTYIFTETLSKGSYNWSIGTENINGDTTNSSNRSLEIDWIFNVGESYTASILEGATTNFTANFTTNGTILTIANLTYNSTGNLASINSINSSFYTATKNITVPSVSSDTNLSFFWNITLSTGYIKDFTSQNQTVLNFNVDNCSTNTAVLYNFTIVDEKSQDKINATGDNTTGRVDLIILTDDRNSEVGNFSSLYNRTNPFSVCLSSNLSSGESYKIDATIQYDADGWAVELYHIDNSTLTNDDFPTNITLYDLDDDQSQEFKITYKDSTFLPVANAIIQIQRKYVDEGLFRTVEIPKTDANGETVAHLKTGDVIYTFIISKGGVILDTFSNKIVVCQNPTLQTCEINFNTFSSSTAPADFTTLDDFTFTLTYDNDTRDVSSAFTVPSGSISTVSLNITLYDQFGNTTIGSQKLTSSSGTLTVNVPASYGNGTVIAQVYKDDTRIGEGLIKLKYDSSEIFGQNRIFLILFMYLTLIGIGISDNPTYTMVWFLLGFILAVSVNFIGVTTYLGAGASALWLVGAVIIVLIKMGNR